MSDQGFQLPTPGPEHELMKPFEGTFKSEVKMWFGPGEPSISTGTMINSWDLGGLYLTQHYTGDAMEGPFPGFQGRGYWGYNQGQKQFEGFWIDNVSSAMQTEQGNVDPSGKVWEMRSEFHHGDAVMQKRSEIKVVSDDEHVMSSFVTPPGGEEFKNMEITYKRA